MEWKIRFFSPRIYEVNSELVERGETGKKTEVRKYRGAF